MLNNLDHTFTTPVFNGSASLRNAAGELIEDVVRSTRRKQTVDDAYLDELYDKVTSLYRLDQLSQTIETSKELGPLPSSSRWFLTILGCTWGLIALFYGRKYIQKRKSS